MAGDLNTHIAILLAKLESSDGVDSTPVAANAIQVDGVLELGRDWATRTPRDSVVVGSAIQARPPLAPKGGIANWQSTLPVRGTRDGLAYSASNLPELDVFLQSAGFGVTVDVTGGAETALYKPAATGLKGHTEYGYTDGKLRKLLGARTDIDFAFDSGGPIMATVKRMGLYQVPTDTALVASPVYGTSVHPVTESLAVTIDGFAAGIIRKWSCSVGNSIRQRKNANAAGGIATPRVRSRKPTWSITLEEELIGTKDLELLEANNTSIAITFFLNASQYNRFRWTAPSARIESVKPSDDEGTRVVTISGGCYDSTPGANDAVQFKFE
jgi:hypothetical protein